MLRIDPASIVPAYEQIAKGLRAELVSGLLLRKPVVSSRTKAGSTSSFIAVRSSASVAGRRPRRVQWTGLSGR